MNTNNKQTKRSNKAVYFKDAMIELEEIIEEMNN